MKREAEALLRAVYNMRSARDDIFRKIDDAMETQIVSVLDFAQGHHDLYRVLQTQVTDAMARLDEGIRTPPPLPTTNEDAEGIPNDVDSFLKQLRPSQQQYPQ